MEKFLQIGVATDAVKYFHESLKFTLVRNKMFRPWSARRQKYLLAPAITSPLGHNTF
jgi:hypothetical protein